MKPFILILLIALSMQSDAEKYILFESSKEYPEVVSQLKMYDFQSGQVLFESETDISYMNDAFVLRPAGTTDLYVFSRQRKGKLKIEVRDQNDFQVKAVINTLKLSEELNEGSDTNFIHWFNDNKELVLMVGEGRKKSLEVYDLSTHQKTFSHKIGMRNSTSELSHDGRYVYVKDNNTFKNNRKLKIFDLQLKKALPEINLGNDDHDIHSFKNYLLVSNEATRSKNDTTKYWHLNVYDLHANGQVISKHVSNRLQSYVTSIDNKTLVIANRNYQSPQKLELFRLAQGQVSPIPIQLIDINLTQIKWHKPTGSLMVFGKNKFVSLDVNSGKVKYEANLPFNAEGGTMNKSGDQAYIKTDQGGRMVMVDLNSGRMINELLVGTASNRASRGFTKSLLIASSMYFGGTLMWFDVNEDVNLQFSEDRSILYLLSEKTDDVTLYDAVDFSERKGLITGTDTFGMFKNTVDGGPFIILSEKRITLMEPNGFEVRSKIRTDRFLFFDATKNMATVLHEGKLKRYSTLTGELIDKKFFPKIKQVLKVDSQTVEL